MVYFFEKKTIHSISVSYRSLQSYLFDFCGPRFDYSKIMTSPQMEKLHFAFCSHILSSKAVTLKDKDGGQEQK